MKKNNQSDPVLSLQNPWDDNDNSVWLASTIRLCRNVEKFKFPLKLEADRQKQIIGAVGKGILSSGLLSNPTLVRADEITPLQKEYLAEHFLPIQSYMQVHSGEAFIIDDSGQFLATINIGDHVHLHFLDAQGELENTWNRAITLESSLGKVVPYAFSPKYGFLTSDFNNCGTGLIITVFLQLPALVHSEKIDDALDKLADTSLHITGIHGNPTEIIGDVIVVQNNYTLGLTEENIISSMRSFTTKIMVEENSIKSKISHEESADIKDKVSRAFGILVHSYQIEAVEALNALSLLKLGVELEWLTGISIKEINRLFFKCRRAHLLKEFGELLKPEEVLHKRAEFIHKSLKNVKQVI